MVLFEGESSPLCSQYIIQSNKNLRCFVVFNSIPLGRGTLLEGLVFTMFLFMYLETRNYINTLIT
jgi:hypothetical protein